MNQSTRVNTKAQEAVKRGLIAGLPLILSYIPVAITFGVVAKQSGLTISELTMMSVFIYAGAAQFMGVNMISVGSGAIEIIVATFILNFRHFIMSFSFMNQLRNIPIKFKLPLTLGLTDETFAVASVNAEESEKEQGVLFYTTLILSAYLAWIFGTVIGGLLGEIIPPKVSASMGIALYAMFIGLLVPMVKKELKVGMIALIAMLINWACSQVMTDGWAIVCGTVVGGFSGVFLLKEYDV